MFIQQNLKNLFDNYISGFPKNNLSEPKWVTGFWENKIITEYDVDGAKIRLEIMYEPVTNEFEIKKFDGEFRSAYIAVIKKKGNDSAEQIIKNLYGELALTKAVAEEIIKEAVEAKKEEIKEEKEKEAKSEEMEFMDSQKEGNEEKGKGGTLKKK